MWRGPVAVASAVLIVLAVIATVSFYQPDPVSLEDVASDAAVQAMRDMDHKLEMQAHHQLSQAKRSDRLARLHNKKALSEQQLKVVAEAKHREAVLAAQEVQAQLAEQQASAKLAAIVHKEDALKKDKKRAEKRAETESALLDKEEARIQRLKDKELQIAAHADAQKMRRHAIEKEVLSSQTKQHEVEHQIKMLSLQAEELKDKAKTALARAAKSDDAAKNLRQVAKEHLKIAQSLQKKMKEVLRTKAHALKHFIVATQHAALLAQESAANNVQELFQTTGGSHSSSLPATQMLEASDKQVAQTEQAKAHPHAAAAAAAAAHKALFTLPEDPRVARAVANARADQAKAAATNALLAHGATKEEAEAVITAATKEAKREAYLANQKVMKLKAEVVESATKEQQDHAQVASMLNTLAATEAKLAALVKSAHAATAALKAERVKAAKREAVLESALTQARQRAHDVETEDNAEKFVRDAHALLQDASVHTQALAQTRMRKNVRKQVLDAAAPAAPAAPAAGVASAGSAATSTTATAGSAGGAVSGAAASTDSTHTNADDFDPLAAFNNFLDGQTVDSAAASNSGAASGANTAASAGGASSAAAAAASGDDSISTNVDNIFGGGADAQSQQQVAANGTPAGGAASGTDSITTNIDVIDARHHQRISMQRALEQQEQQESQRKKRLHLPDPASVKMSSAAGVGLADLSHTSNFEAANDFLNSVQDPSSPDNEESQYYAHSIEYSAPNSDLLQTGEELLDDNGDIYARSGFQDAAATANLLGYEQRVQQQETRRDAEGGLGLDPATTF